MVRPAMPMVKLKPKTHSILQEMSREDKKPMGEIIACLVDRHQRERFWRGAQQDLARLKSDPAAWKSYRNESAEWDATSADGLGDEPRYPEDETSEDGR